METPPVIYVVDHDASLVSFVRDVLTRHDYQVRCFSEASDFLFHQPLSSDGCVITGLCSPGIRGLENHGDLHRHVGNYALIAICESDELPLAIQLLMDDSITILRQPLREDELLSAVREGVEQSQSRHATRDFSDSVEARLVQLTESERNVLNGFMEGLSRKAIASALDLSQRSVDRRRESLLRKMGAASLHELFKILSHFHPSSDRYAG